MYHYTHRWLYRKNNHHRILDWLVVTFYTGHPAFPLALLLFVLYKAARVNF